MSAIRTTPPLHAERGVAICRTRLSQPDRQGCVLLRQRLKSRASTCKAHARRILTSRSGTTSNCSRRSSIAPLSVSRTCVSSATPTKVICTISFARRHLAQLSASVQNAGLDRMGEKIFDLFRIGHLRLLAARPAFAREPTRGAKFYIGLSAKVKARARRRAELPPAS